MNPRTGLALFVLGLIVLAGGYALGPASVATERAAFAQGSLMFPDLPRLVQGATKIELTAKGQHLTLERPTAAADAIWGLPDHAGYPAQPGRVHELLAGLAELRLVEPRTSDPALYGRLGLGDAAQPDSDAADLRVLGPDGKLIAAVQAGHRQTHPATPSAAAGAAGAAPDTLFVRRPDEAGSWLAEGRLAIDTDAQSWLQRDVVNLDAAQIAQITARTGAATLVLARDGATMKLTQPVPPPPLDEAKASETARALEMLAFQDVRKADPAAAVLASTTYRTTDGTELTATELGDTKDPWTRFAATGPDAAALAGRLAGWDYRFDSFKTHLLAPTLESLAPPPMPVTTPGDRLPGMVTPGLVAPGPQTTPPPADPPVTTEPPAPPSGGQTPAQ